MIEINLVPDVKQELLRAQKQRNIVISVAIILAIAAGAIVIIAAAYVYGAQKLMMDTANKTIDEQYATLNKVEDLDKMLTIQNQLKQISKLNASKNAGSRLYGMLNVIIPAEPHEVTVSSMLVEPAGTTETGTEETAEGTSSGEGARITIEGQTVGSYASLEVFEKMIAAAVIEYKVTDGTDKAGDLNCGNPLKQCRRLAVGDGDRSQAIHIAEMSFGEDQEGNRILRFKLSFTVVPELLSNTVSDVTIKIGANGNVTDSYLNAPRAIFKDRARDEGGK